MGNGVVFLIPLRFTTVILRELEPKVCGQGRVRIATSERRDKDVHQEVPEADDDLELT